MAKNEDNMELDISDELIAERRAGERFLAHLQLIVSYLVQLGHKVKVKCSSGKTSGCVLALEESPLA